MHYSKLFLRTYARSAACYHRPVFIDLWVVRRSAASVGAVSTLFFAIALISTSTASALLVHRNHPTSDLIAVQDQQLTGQQQCTTQSYFYAPKPVMQPAFMDLLLLISEFFVGQQHQLVQALPSFFVFVLISTSLRWAFIQISPPSA